MWKTNLKVLAVTLVVLAFYTMVANVIPQLQSEVPETLDLSLGVTTEELVVAGERTYNGAGGCTACHGLGTRAPNLVTDHAGEGVIGARCRSRVPNVDCKTYLYEALTDPTKFVVRGFEPIMTDTRRQLSEEQIWATIAFLQSQGGEVTVTADDIARTAPATTTVAAPAAGPAMTATLDPVALISEKGCIACHTLDGKGGPIGPSFDRIGAGRTRESLRRSILEPNADTAKGFERFAGTMPASFGQVLTAAQLEALVVYLAGKR
ncbi:MAG: c-type cytochrome [Gemmatimonadaceae bacterium]